MGRDIQNEPFTAIGVGDMSGDVFGNGMLLSKHTRLLAAFDHRHIFVDPDPDTAKSYDERARLFALARSSWDRLRHQALISKGGGVFARTAKKIALTPEMKALTGVEADHLSPTELIKALLKSETDLLWFGGIGTYIKASTQNNLDVGDRANDALRVDGVRGARARSSAKAPIWAPPSSAASNTHSRADASTPTPSTIRPASIPPTTRSI